MRLEDLTSRRFARLVVQSRVQSTERGARWQCQCDCGSSVQVDARDLRTGNTKSCGCLRREPNNLRHGHTKGVGCSRTYKSWTMMIYRCTKPDYHAFGRYGGRGITVCESWRTFDNFLADMGERPPGKTLDRIENDDGYYPANCRWATPKQQRANQGARQCA